MHILLPNGHSTPTEVLTERYPQIVSTGLPAQDDDSIRTAITQIRAMSILPRCLWGPVCS